MFKQNIFESVDVTFMALFNFIASCSKYPEASIYFVKLVCCKWNIQKCSISFVKCQCFIDFSCYISIDQHPISSGLYHVNTQNSRVRWIQGLLKFQCSLCNEKTNEIPFDQSQIRITLIFTCNVDRFLIQLILAVTGEFRVQIVKKLIKENLKNNYIENIVVCLAPGLCVK